MSSSNIVKEYIIPNKLGLHARVAARLSKLLLQHSSSIYIDNGSYKINGKSILEIMSLGAEQGSKLTFFIDGDDSTEVIESLDEFFANNLGDED